MANKKLSFLVLLMFMVSCSTNSRSPIDLPTLISPPASTATQRAALPILTFTSVSTATMNFTPVPSWTPVPALVDENSFLDFISFTKKSVCRFPCWAGIYPGKSSWDEALLALNPMKSIAQFKTYLGVEGLFRKENILVWFLSGKDFTVNGNLDALVANRSTVKLIHMSVEGSSTPSANNPSRALPLPRNFELQSVLRDYGLPSMVFIYTFIHDEQGPVPFKILLVYPENHFYITYYREAKLSGNMVVACDPDLLLELDIVDSQDKLISAEAIATAPETQGIRLENWKSVEQVLGISPEKFHEIHAASATECMTFPSKLWDP